jgi:hypothetical protein
MQALFAARKIINVAHGQRRWRCWNRAHRQHPTDRDLLTALISIARGTGDFATALRDPLELVALDPTDMWLGSLASDLEKRQARCARAGGDLSITVERAPADRAPRRRGSDGFAGGGEGFEPLVPRQRNPLLETASFDAAATSPSERDRGFESVSLHRRVRREPRSR